MIIIIFNFIFIKTKNPLIIGLILICQTIVITLILGKINITFWISFIIFLVFIGGILILFIYVISLLNNNNIKFINFKYIILYIIILILIYNYNYNNNNEIIIFKNIIHFNNENSLNLIKIYNIPNIIINFLIIIYLFIIIIVTSKITNMNKGPFYKF